MAFKKVYLNVSPGIIYEGQTPEADEPGGSGGGASAATTNCGDTNASLILVSNSGAAGSTRTQVFKVGCLVSAGFTYSLAVYSYTVTITAITGDTPASIASKLITAINNTTAAQWNTYGSAATGKPGFPPTASNTANADEIELTLNYQNQFAGWASGVQAPPPSPPPAAVNEAPVANAGSNQTIKLPVNSVTLDGSGSYDPESGPLTFAWLLVEGPNTPQLTNADKAIATAANLIQGHYAFQLTVMDAQGASSYATVYVDVQPEDRAAVINTTAPVINIQRAPYMPTYSSGGGGAGSGASVSEIKPSKPKKTNWWLWAFIIGSTAHIIFAKND